MTDVTVQAGAALPVQSIDFTDPTTLAFAQTVAAAINGVAASDVTGFVSGGQATVGASFLGIVVDGGQPTTLVASGSASVIGDSGGLTYTAPQNSTDLIVLAGGDNFVTVGSGATSTIVAAPGNNSIVAAGAANIVVGDGTNTIAAAQSAGDRASISASGTDDLMNVGAGAATVGETGSGAIIDGGSGADLIIDGGTNDTVNAGSGATTIDGSGGTYNLGTGNDYFTGLRGGNTLVGAASGSATVIGGGQDSVVANGEALNFMAEGDATVDGGTAGTIVTGSDGSTITYNGTAGSNVLFGGTGAETVDASGSTANVAFYGGPGADQFIGGAGNDAFDAGSGTATVTGYGGLNTYYFDATRLSGPGDVTIITDFKSGDVIDLVNFGSSAVSDALASVQPSQSGLTMTLEDGAQIIFVGTPTLNTTNVVAGTAPCFAAGTRILAEHGEVPVEALRIGDRVATTRGMAAVAWLGHRRVNVSAHPDPAQVRPIRVRRGAISPGVPQRDVILSPDHALFIDDVLIPVRYLVNGRTIAPVACDRVTYWHVELPAHAVLFAEGLPAESFLDTGNRAAFDNGGATVDLHPDFARHVWAAESCAPLVLGGPRLVRTRQRLLDQALALGHATTDAPGIRLLSDGAPLRADTDGRSWHARLPCATTEVRIVSKVWTPSHIRADETDERRLGIAVSRLWLGGREMDLDSPGLAAGWHAREAFWRWTDGDGVLETAGATDLAFEVAMAGTYWRDRNARRRLQA